MQKTINHLNEILFPTVDYDSILGGLNSLNKTIQDMSTLIPSMSFDPLGKLSVIVSSYKAPGFPSDLFSSYKLYPTVETEYNMEAGLPSQPDPIATSIQKKNIVRDSTDNNEINNKNEDFLNVLKLHSSEFTTSIKKADFEDGMMNDVADEVEIYINQNKYATYLWLHFLYSQNQNDYKVISALLRIIGLTVDIQDSDLLLPIVKCGLNDSHIEAQEAALMVIEKWRTKECLDALNTSHFSSKWISKYAESIVKELEEELRNVA